MARSTRIRRWCRRGLALLIGLALGWYAAGQWQEARLVSAAEEAANRPISAETDGSRGPADAGDDRDAAMAHGDAAEGEGSHPATALVPRHDSEPAVPAWLGYVVGGIAGLFALALLMGVVVRRTGHRDPGTVATEQDRTAHHHDQP